MHEGEIVTLIGANGAGKTTTLRTINGVNHPREGRFTSRARDHERGAAHDRQDGDRAVARGQAALSAVTVHDNLELGAYLRTDKGTPGRHRPRLRPLSAPRRAQPAEGRDDVGRRAADAGDRARAHGAAELLLLDEPSLGLAPIIVEKIFEIIHEINAQGTPILLVEQNALMALDAAHRGYVMEVGVIALEGPAKELRANERVRKAYLGDAGLPRQHAVNSLVS